MTIPVWLFVLLVISYGVLIWYANIERRRAMNATRASGTAISSAERWKERLASTESTLERAREKIAAHTKELHNLAASATETTVERILKVRRLDQFLLDVAVILEDQCKHQDAKQIRQLIGDLEDPT